MRLASASALGLFSAPWDFAVRERWLLLWGLHLAAFSLVALHCLRHRRDASSALLWIFASWSFPVVGPLLFLAFGINRVPIKGWHKQRSDQEFLSRALLVPML